MNDHLDTRLKNFASNIRLPGEEQKHTQNSIFLFFSRFTILPTFWFPDLFKKLSKKKIEPKKVELSDGTKYVFFKEKDTFTYFDEDTSQSRQRTQEDADAFLFRPTDSSQKRILSYLHDKIRVIGPDGTITDYGSALAFFREKKSRYEGEIFEDRYSVLRNNILSYGTPDQQKAAVLAGVTFLKEDVSPIVTKEEVALAEEAKKKKKTEE